jgi:hypothetical protein
VSDPGSFDAGTVCTTILRQSCVISRVGQSRPQISRYVQVGKSTPQVDWRHLEPTAWMTPLNYLCRCDPCMCSADPVSHDPSSIGGSRDEIPGSMVSTQRLSARSSLNAGRATGRLTALRERFNETLEPPIGAHLITPRRGYTHHCIYVGHGHIKKSRQASRHDPPHSLQRRPNTHDKSRDNERGWRSNIGTHGVR